MSEFPNLPGFDRQEAGAGEVLRPTTAFRRFGLLVGLRKNLILRGPGRGVGARIVFGIVMVQMAVFAGVLSISVYRLAKESPELADNLVRTIFLAVFGLQLMLGAMGVAIGEFYDTNRLLHLPVGPREIFGAMSVSSVFTPGTVFVAAPMLGVLAAGTEGPLVTAARAGVFLLGLWFAHLVALTLGFTFLRFFSRRRFRDIATIIGSMFGIGIYLAFRAFSGGGDHADPQALLASEHWLALRPLPSQWFAEAFVGIGSKTPSTTTFGFLFAGLLGLVVLLRLGSNAFRATYDAAGEIAHAGETVVDVKPGLSRFLPADIAIVVRTTYAVFRREPQLRAMLFQQLIFFAVPVVMQRGSASGPRFGADGGPLPFVIPLMIVLSHSAMALSCFGIDGRGLGLMFGSPIRRTRLLLGRVLALFGIFAAADVLAAVAITAVVRGMRGEWDGASREAATLLAVTLTGDLAQLACRVVVSVLAPMAVVRTRRNGAPRLGREGCATIMGRMLALIPVAACTLAAAGIALIPRWFGLDPVWYFASFGVAALFSAALVMAGVAVAAHLLAKREGAVLSVMSDVGD